MKSKIIRQAFIKSLPVMAGYIVLGIGFGILLKKAGYGVIWSFCMSAFIYAGSMQYVGVGLISQSASLVTAALTTFMVNARHLFYSISMVERYRGAGKWKPYLIFGLTDETYSLLCTDEETEDIHLFRFLVTFFNHCYWITGSVLGSLIGSILPFSSAGIEFSMTALFIASFTEQWITSEDHRPALCGLVSTLVCLLIFGRDSFLIPAMILMTVILTAMRKQEKAS